MARSLTSNGSARGDERMELNWVARKPRRASLLAPWVVSFIVMAQSGDYCETVDVWL